MTSRTTGWKLLVLASCAAPLWGQHSPAERIGAGRKLFEHTCTACHGQNAQGGRAPGLTGQLRHGALPSEMVRNILKGIPGTQMPAFPMPPQDARAIVAYLRHLRSAGPDAPVTGNAAEGRNLFFGAAGCSRCHMYKGAGGRLGPDLTSVGELKTVPELERLLAEPHDSLVHGFETVEVRFRDGRRVDGVRKNEDTFSLQMMDKSEHLLMLRKGDLEEVRETGKSLMPVAAVTGRRADDVIAFLKKGTELPAPQAWTPAADLNVSFERLENAAREPQNWLTYWGDLRGTHSSALDSITPANVRTLASAWTYQFGGSGVETTPIVVDGIMFVTGPLDNAAALDARTGRVIWRYARALPPGVHSDCTVMTNRGFAILGDRLYLATLDAHLVALDAKTGNVVWDVAVDDYRTGYSITHAPLAIDGKILVGVTAGECAVTGFLDGYEAASGRRLWRLRTTPAKGDKARATWSANSADVGGGPTWMTGTYDSETDTLFWSTGNPSPDYDGSVRHGDNLYTCSVLALDPRTGRMKWYFQFTPHDTHDWDATETNVLVDAPFRGRMRRLMLHADRNAFFYVLDRETGEFLLGKPFARQTWARGLDDRGRPMVIPGTDPTPQGVFVCPDASGATNWAAPSWSPVTRLFYVAARDSCATYTSVTREARPGEPWVGSGQKEHAESPGFIRAIDPQTGEVRWNFEVKEGSSAAGVLATAGGVVFAGSREGNLIALDAATGKPLWHYQTGTAILSSPISYSVDGRQYVAVSTSSALLAFALPVEGER